MQLPEQVTNLSPEAFETWGRYGQWLTERYGDPNVNSVGHLVVPPTHTRRPFMLGVDDSDCGVVADLHSPFLVQVPSDPQMIEIVAMNANLASFGAVRLVPEDDSGLFHSLEVRHQMHAAMLTQEWLYFYVDLITRTSQELLTMLQPAFGGMVCA